jgi:hypothetical protein
MSKKGEQPRDKLGKYKANPSPSLLATPVPHKSSRCTQPSSSLADKPSSPDLSGISDLPGSFPSSAAASPVCLNSPPLVSLLCQTSRAQTTFPRLPASPQLTPTHQLIPITHSISTQTPPPANHPTCRHQRNFHPDNFPAHSLSVNRFPDEPGANRINVYPDHTLPLHFTHTR